MLKRNFLLLSLGFLFLVGCNNSEDKKTKSEETTQNSENLDNETKINTEEKESKEAEVPLKEEEKAEDNKSGLEENKEDEKVTTKNEENEKINKEDEKKDSIKSKEEEENPNQKDDVTVAKEKMQELQTISKEKLTDWIEENVATKVIKGRVFAQNWKKYPKKLKDAIEKTWSKFISLNTESFLPMIKDYSVKKIECARNGKKVKKFLIEMINSKTNETIQVVILSTNNLRIIDIQVSEVSLLSLLKTAASDILNESKDKVKSWNDFIKKGQGEAVKKS
ncbi:MAG: hypothetical protein LBS83_03795 [Holosporales bacterium]|jgi:hypothetical protein|nr:hypothetical protein [Holosporales bacterium]